MKIFLFGSLYSTVHDVKVHWPHVLFTMFKMSTMRLRNVVRCSKFCQGLRYWLTLDYKILNLHDCVNWILPPWPNFEQNRLFRETKQWIVILTVRMDLLPAILPQIYITRHKNYLNSRWNHQNLQKQTNKQKKVLRKFSWSLWPLKYFFCPALPHFSTDLIKKWTNCSGDHTTSNTGHFQTQNGKQRWMNYLLRVKQYAPIIHENLFVRKPL